MRQVKPMSKQDYLSKHNTELAAHLTWIAESCQRRGNLKRLDSVWTLICIGGSMSSDERWNGLRMIRSMASKDILDVNVPDD